jgi:hypothetical protein
MISYLIRSSGTCLLLPLSCPFRLLVAGDLFVPYRSLPGERKPKSPCSTKIQGTLDLNANRRSLSSSTSKASVPGCCNLLYCVPFVSARRNIARDVAPTYTQHILPSMHYTISTITFH